MAAAWGTVSIRAMAVKELVPDRGIDVITQDAAPGSEIAFIDELHAFTEKRLTEGWFPLCAFADRVAEVSCQCHVLLPFPFRLHRCLCSGLFQCGFLLRPVFPPYFLGVFYVAILSLLRTAAEQDHKLLAIFAEINPVARPKIDP